MIPMPFKPSTAKKYARLILKWMLPIGFALIVLNGAYRGLVYDHDWSYLLGMYYIVSLVLVIMLVWITLGLGLGKILKWIYQD